MQPRVCRSLVVVAVVSAGIGCSAPAGPPVPVLVEFEGVLLMNDDPVPRAQIQFMPETENYGPDYYSIGVTNYEGRFKLECPKIGSFGAVVGTHAVVVTDWIPDELRGGDESSRKKRSEYLERLENRPIHENYATMLKTPLRIEIKVAQKDCTLKLMKGG